MQILAAVDLQCRVVNPDGALIRLKVSVYPTLLMECPEYSDARPVSKTYNVEANQEIVGGYAAEKGIIRNALQQRGGPKEREKKQINVFSFNRVAKIFSYF